jgi:hypothetical protein
MLSKPIEDRSHSRYSRGCITGSADGARSRLASQPFAAQFLLPTMQLAIDPSPLHQKSAANLSRRATRANLLHSYAIAKSP